MLSDVLKKFSLTVAIRHQHHDVSGNQKRIRRPVCPARNHSSSTVYTANSQPFGSWSVYACDEPRVPSQDFVLPVSNENCSRFFGDDFAVLPHIDGSAVHARGFTGHLGGTGKARPTAAENS